MDLDMQRSETYIGDVGRRCNTRLLEKSLVNSELISKRRTDRSGPLSALHDGVLALT